MNTSFSQSRRIKLQLESKSIEQLQAIVRDADKSIVLRRLAAETIVKKAQLK